MRIRGKTVQECALLQKAWLAPMLTHPPNRDRPAIKKQLHRANTHREKNTHRSQANQKKTTPAPHIQQKLLFRDQNLHLAFFKIQHSGNAGNLKPAQGLRFRVVTPHQTSFFFNRKKMKSASQNYGNTPTCFLGEFNIGATPRQTWMGDIEAASREVFLRSPHETATIPRNHNHYNERVDG